MFYLIFSIIVITLLAWLFHTWQKLSHLRGESLRVFQDIISTASLLNDQIPLVLEIGRSNDLISQEFFKKIVEKRASETHKKFHIPHEIAQHVEIFYQVVQKLSFSKNHDISVVRFCQNFQKFELLREKFNNAVRQYNEACSRRFYKAAVFIFAFHPLVSIKTCD